MASIALGDVRDVVVVVTGILYIIGALILAVVTWLLLHFGRKGTDALHALVQDKLVPALKRCQALAERVEARTARLPGGRTSKAPLTEVVETVNEVRDMKPPFRSRRRTWRPF